jgi:hypothetical protein
MRTVRYHFRKAPISSPGFTLPAVLVVVGALLILAVGILLVASIERSTARSFVDRERAELAARAGLEDLRGILTTETANDEFLVIRSQAATPIDASDPAKERQRAPFLFLSRGKSDGTFRHVPLFSTTQIPSETSLIAPAVEPLVGSDETKRIDFTTLPFQDKVRAAWLPVEDEKGRVVARYAYWVEDLQGRLDPTLAGNEDGTGGIHVRTRWPFPAAGINPDPPSDTERALNQVALFAMDPSATEENQGSVGKTLFKNRRILVSPESSLAAAGFTPPLARLESVVSDDPYNAAVKGTPGQLADRSRRAVEEALFPGIQPYKERPLIPFASGIDPSASGSPKLNLNQLLATGGNNAVDQMAALIRKALPKFDQRKGGFPDDYVKTLAANAIDYADLDREPTSAAGSYRGLDSYPLVSEFLMRFRWEDARTENGRKFLVLSATTYVELWNMGDKEVNGSAEVTYETAYRFPLGANPEVSLADLTDATPKLAEKDGYRWFPAFGVSLKPNEYRIFNCGTVTYKIDAGPASFFIASPLVLEGETFGSSKAGYRLKWNGTIIDQSRGGLHRNNSSLNYPSDTSNQPRQRVRCTIPSHSHTRNGSFVNNMGDPRMSFYLLAPQDANAYPDNYSPNRRNIRWGTIYRSDGATKTKIYGRVMPSEWPDGGHNSTYESNSFYTDDQRVNPDDNRFMPTASSTLRNPPVDEAPMRLSNLGRFYSATELGRVYDPVMWQISSPAGANLPWGNVLSSSPSSPDYGGGNTLRIGRPEHPKFDEPANPGLEAWRLLDLFHAGISRSETPAERQGPVQSIEGAVNLNTAKRDTLRALVLGALTQDPKMALRSSESHNTTSLMAPPVTPYKTPAAELNAEAARIADAIIELRRQRPFSSPAEIAEARDTSGRQVFGNRELLADGTRIHRSDSASEESFARIYESSTVRSRNFRIWVVGQSVAPTTSSTAKPEVLAEVRRAFTVFADPGERSADGSIDSTKVKLRIRHENDF